MAMRIRYTLTNWERGDKEPHAVEFLEEMSKILKVPLEKLVVDEKAVNLEIVRGILKSAQCGIRAEFVRFKIEELKVRHGTKCRRRTYARFTREC